MWIGDICHDFTYRLLIHTPYGMQNTSLIDPITYITSFRVVEINYYNPFNVTFEMLYRKHLLSGLVTLNCWSALKLHYGALMQFSDSILIILVPVYGYDRVYFSKCFLFKNKLK